MMPIEVWHFQDNAVTGELYVDEMDPIWPFVEQLWWMEEYYRFWLPYCTNVPDGVDGPDEIEMFSKDLAFELHAECLVVGQFVGGLLVTPQMYSNWVQIGKPPSWCHPGHVMGDADESCVVDAGDVLSGPNPNFQDSFGKAWPDPAYAPECDTNNDKIINAADILGGALVVIDPAYAPSVTQSGIGNNFGKVVPVTCP